MNSSTPILNEDVILQILSYCPPEVIVKFRLLNKSINKRTYESYFVNSNRLRTHVFGYFIQFIHSFACVSCFVSGHDEETLKDTGISLKYLEAKDLNIEACDTNNGILLGVDIDRSESDKDIKNGVIVGCAKNILSYIICKPATKEYQIIPNPDIQKSTKITGLLVVKSNPFWYKIIRVSKGPINYNCEVFDSETFAWKRINDLKLSKYDEYLPNSRSLSRHSNKPILSYGFLHWLTTSNNVIRFCMETETWSFFPVPEDLINDESLVLISYKGKLGLLSSKEEYGLWVLKSSLERLWINMKDMKTRGFEDKFV